MYSFINESELKETIIAKSLEKSVTQLWLLIELKTWSVIPWFLLNIREIRYDMCLWMYTGHWPEMGYLWIEMNKEWSVP